MTSQPAVLGGSPAFPEGLPLARPQVGDVPATVARIQAVLDSGRMTNGATVRELEERAAAYLGVRHVVAVSSCTSGLLLVLQACGAAGRVVLPSFTFSATAHVVHWTGGRPIFADVDPLSLTLDPGDVAPRMEGAAAVLATHLYGTPCAVEDLQAVADGAGVPLVYDAAHALGSRRGGRPIGGFGTAEVFSLSPTKVVVAGEGGLVATDDDALAAAVTIGRDYGNPGDYDCLFPGLNARMSELHAAVGLDSLTGLDDRVAWRTGLAQRFHAALAGLAGVTFPRVAEGDTSTYKDLTLLIDEAVAGLSPGHLASALRAEGIDTRRYYAPPVHRQKAYAALPPADLPVTDRAADRALTVPLWSQMTERQVDGLADAVTRIAAAPAAVADALGGR